jgi:hypothetical protein
MGQLIALLIVAIVLCFAAALVATLAAASIGLWLDLLDQLAERRRRKARPPRRPSFAELLMPLPPDQDPDWRRSFNHENTKRPSGPPPLRFRRSKPPEQFIRMDEGPVQRGNGNGGPTTPKPLGYQPRPSRPGANPPPSEP